jgi:hypothetical protein
VTTKWKAVLRHYSIVVVCGKRADAERSWDVALFLPFRGNGKRQQGATQSEGRKSPDSMSDGARCRNVQHTAAKDG